MIVINTMNDLLSSKVQKLHSALNQANDIIEKLDQENKRLNDILNSLSENNENYTFDYDTFNEPVYTMV